MEQEVKTQQEHTPDYWIKYEQDKFKEAKNYRSTRIEKQWMINYAYYKGYQNIKYNTTTGQIDWGSEDPLKFYVNQIYAIVRAIRNSVTKDIPTFEVDALPFGNVEPEIERAYGLYLSSMYEKLNVKHKIKEIVLYGLLYGLGVFQYGFDPEADNGQGEVWLESFDPFDIYIDPHATGIDDARYVIKVIKRPLDIVKQNQLYTNTDRLISDNRQSESAYKELMLSKDRDVTTGESGTVILHEAWCKTEEGVRVVTTANGQLLRNELTDSEKLPFVVYQPDVNPNELYGEGWVKNLVPLNRALNYLERSSLEYHVLFAKGKYLADNNVNVKMVTNENGQIIRKSRAGEFSQMDMKPMTSSLYKQIDNISRYMEDVGAAHETFMGRAPNGVTAAIAIETLVANNMANLSDLLDNLEITLSELGEAILQLGYKYYDTSKAFKTEDNNREIFKVRGQGAPEIEDAIPLPQDAQVRVTIGSGIAHTKGARQELALQLYSAGVLDRRTLLERYGEDADTVEARLAEQMMGAPVSEGGMPAGQGPQMGEVGEMGAMTPDGFPSPEEAVGDFLAQVEADGLTLDPTLQDPEALLAVVSGQLQVEVLDGMVVPVG